MINELQVFSYEGSEIRTVQLGGEPWWVLKDICDVLELSNPSVIADRLDDQTAKIDGLIAKQDDFIERLRERRAALITAAVTGQIAIAANIAAEAAA